MEVKIAISKIAKNKAEGVDQYRLNYSFETVDISLEELVKHLAVDGYPVCSAHKPDPPAPTSRWKTPRNSGNYISSQVIMLDDDGRMPDGVEFWNNDPFFQQYGYFIYHSSSSTKEKAKLRPVFVLEDYVVYSVDEMKLINEAVIDYYEGRLDPISDGMRIYYGSENAEHEVLGNFLPHRVLYDEIVTPYKLRKEILKATQELERENRKIFHQANGTTKDMGKVDVPYLRSRLKGLIKWWAEIEKGENRNKGLFRIGCFVGKMRNTDWASPLYDEAVRNLDRALLWASKQNNYIPDHARDIGEVQRIVGYGFQAGLESGEQLEAPVVSEWSIFQPGQRVSVKNRDGIVFPAVVERVVREKLSSSDRYSIYYKLAGDERYYGVWQLSPREDSFSLDNVQPPLTDEQKKQVKDLIETEMLSRFLANSFRNQIWNYPETILDFLKLGAKGEDTQTAPLSARGKLANIEYRHNMQVTYENDVYGVFEAEKDGDRPSIWFTETTDCVHGWLNYGEGAVNNDGSNFTFKAMPHLPVDRHFFRDNDVILLPQGFEMNEREIYALKGQGVRIVTCPLPIDSEHMTKDLLNRFIYIARKF